WLGYACGACEYCLSGWSTLCEKQLNTGYFIDGAYADYALAFAKYVVKVPENVNPLEAAPLSCAGVTTYKAVKMSGARSSDLVAIFGIGGLGHLAVQYAKIAGSTVVAVDLVDEKLELAKKLGADYTINGKAEDPVEA
ncbi:MAG TPA: zinc-dependent alcohol dehydrogenase, partial [Ktedonobacter sp.]|nr:zinc-dependent alcohol dehydrogenase [Ktedonobacter sp.]